MTNIDINLKKISDYQQRVNVTKQSSTTDINRFNSQGQNASGNAGLSFETILKQQLQKNNGLQFSKHAIERVNQRGIQITEDLMQSLNKAVDKARDKGARDVVIIDTSQAFIVNIPNNTVITTISENEMKENVFTNIDSAVIL